MAFDLTKLQTSKADKPPRIVIHGTPGVGKTSLAASFPAPIILDIEQGTPGDVQIPTFGELESYADVENALIALVTQEHDFKTLIIDSLDRLETLVWQHTCAVNGWGTLEDPGFGKGYMMADEHWQNIIRATNKLRTARGMNIVFVAHSAVTRFDDPSTGPYSQYDIRLHKRANALIQDDADFIFFLKRDVVLEEKKEAFGKTTSRGAGGEIVWIYTSERPAHIAKNRAEKDMPWRIQYNKGKGYDALREYLPAQDQPKAKAKPKAETEKEAA